MAHIAGVALPLLSLSGASLGIQISLSSDNLPFGSVVLGSQVILTHPHPVISSAKLAVFQESAQPGIKFRVLPELLCRIECG